MEQKRSTEAAGQFVRGPGKPETGQASSKLAGGWGGLASCEKRTWGLCSKQLLLEPQFPHLCTRTAVIHTGVTSGDNMGMIHSARVCHRVHTLSARSHHDRASQVRAGGLLLLPAGMAWRTEA